jgi:hypothetical protein
MRPCALGAIGPRPALRATQIANAATFMDLLSARAPKAVLLLGDFYTPTDWRRSEFLHSKITAGSARPDGSFVATTIGPKQNVLFCAFRLIVEEGMPLETQLLSDCD